MTNFAVQKRKASAPNFTTHSPIITNLFVVIPAWIMNL